ncbi:hypothetical protein [Corynebacterium bovis]|uniref:hypothetical protein n=1 Tax=Corynebacterium bovis TaxID=36808 RepID=UPI000F633D91|nr:hypothetical protein [Corynebacterium bovis]RRQ12098.1 hypothetical protein CXF47_10435 [Corynebacterium bovis]
MMSATDGLARAASYRRRRPGSPRIRSPRVSSSTATASSCGVAARREVRVPAISSQLAAGSTESSR